MSAGVRAPIPGLSSGEHALSGAVAHYLVNVLRLREGDAFTAFDPANGLEADAAVVRADRADVVARFGATRAGGAATAREIILVQGLAKGDKCDAVVRDATELAATRIIVATTARSVVKLDAERARSRRERWERIANEASRQCGRSVAPIVDAPCDWNEALARVSRDAARFCLWERATEPLGPVLLRALTTPTAIAFAIGPEGGLTDDEARHARDEGWSVVTLGRLTLRTETVAASVLGAALVLGGS
jgi:16S rRNA (uracil1498-N3)-methyltransferase